MSLFLELKSKRLEPRVKGLNPCHWGGMTLLILLYDKYFNINPHHNMSNQRIAAGFIVMMNPYFSFSALMSGISPPVSTAVSHTVALSRGQCTELSGSYNLDLDLRSDDLTWGSNLLILLRSLGYPSDRFWVSEPQVVGWSGPLQSSQMPSQLSTSSCAFQVISKSDTVQQFPLSLVVASSGCETLVLLTLATFCP